MAKITKKSRDLFYAMIIGDGHLDKYGQLNIRHCERQEGYVRWKHKVLKKHNISVSRIRTYKSNGTTQYGFSTKVYKFSKLFRKILYTPKKTVGIRKQLNRLTPLGIAIWYMDDGSLTTLKNKDGYVRGSALRIHTNLSKEENQVIIDYFQEIWNIKFKQNKKNSYYELVMHTKEARKFLQIVEPYVRRVSCMHHKLKIKPIGRIKRSEKAASSNINEEMI